MPCPGRFATPGGEFVATTHATGPHSRWFFVYNETTGEGHGFTYTNNKSSNDEANAEVIGAERTTVNGVETPLLDFASDTAEGWVNNNTLLENAPRLYEVKMWQTTEYNKEGELEGKGPILAQPSKISSLFHSFEDIWKQCGKASSS
jgi:hypothetical protein